MLKQKDIDWLNGYKNKTRTYAVYKKSASDQGHKQTESEGMEKVIACKWKTKENQANIVNQPLLGDAFKSTSICIEEISARELGSSFMQGYPL